MQWTRKKLIGLILFLIIIIGLPISVFLVRQQQDIRQRAANEVAISFDPQEATKNVGEEFDIKVQVNGGTDNVSYVKMSLKFDEELVEYVSFVPSGNYAFITGPTPTETGDLNFEMVDASATAPTGLVDIGVLKLKGKTTGNTSLAVAASELYATGVIGMLTLTGAQPGQFTITDVSLSPTAVCGATNKPLTCTCTQDSQCASQKCAPLVDNPQESVCVPYLSPNPTSTITVTPTLTACQTNTGRPNNCQCANDFQCSSGFCNYPVPGPTGAEEVGLCQVRPTLEPSLPPTNTPTVIPPTATNTPTATLTPTATNTPVPNETRIALSTGLPGIGHLSGDNNSPQSPNRSATIQIFNSANQKIYDANGTLNYKPTNAKYEGTISLGSNFNTGSYYVLLKFNNTLFKRLPGIAQIAQGSDENEALYAPLVSGDMNGDNTLSVADYTIYVACYRNESSCTQQYKDLADFNDDGNATGDNVDLNILLRGFAIRDGD